MVVNNARSLSSGTGKQCAWGRSAWSAASVAPRGRGQCLRHRFGWPDKRNHHAGV